MEPTLRQLRAFRTVATELHFGRAASSLNLAQPTLSKEIKLLERTLGTTLFERGPAGARLTNAGVSLLPHAEAVLADALRLVAEAKQLRGTGSRTVRIAATPSVVNRLLPDVLRSLEAQMPDVEIHVVEVDTGGVPNAVRSGRVDAGIGHHVAATAGCGRRTLAHDELRVVVHASLAGSDAALDLTRFMRLPLLMWPRDQNPEYYDALLKVCQERGLDPLILIGSARISGARSYLLREARAFALVPRDYAVTEPAPLVSRPLAQPASVPLQALWRQPLSSPVSALLRSARDAAEQRLPNDFRDTSTRPV